MWHAVYRSSDGVLVSTGSVVADPLPEGLTSQSYAQPQAGVWDSQTLEFVPATVTPEWTRVEFLRRLTAPERAGIRASTDPVVQDFVALLQLAEYVRADDPDVIAGLGYFESQGLIAAGRAQEILAW